MESLAILRFPLPATAYQAFTELKALASTAAINIHEAAVVVRRDDRSLEAKDTVGFDRADGTNLGSLLGLVIGIIGGPFGLLLGWLTGGAIGATVDATNAAEAASALQWVGSSLTPGETALIAILSEPTPDALDTMAQRLGGTVDRFAASTVQSELEALAEAEAAARDAAEKAMRDARSATRHAKWQEIKDHALAKFRRAKR